MNTIRPITTRSEYLAGGTEARRHIQRANTTSVSPCLRGSIVPVVLSLLCLMCCQVIAQTTQSSPADIKLQLTTEDGRKQIQATVTADGKPVESATVAFTVKRTFGQLDVGKDQTLDDGTAQVPFPADLPGGTTGQLDITAIVQAPTKYSNASAHATFDGAAVIHPSEDQYPRALWAPRAPVLLIVTIVGILVVVWCVYAYVLSQLWAIARER